VKHFPQNDRLGETGESVRKGVKAVRDIQNKRFANGEATAIVCNADLRVGEMRPFCKLQDETQDLMRAAMSQMHLSIGTHHGTLKLAHH